MIIQDPRFAAACVTMDGEVKKFDDIGCLSFYLKKTPGVQVRHRWAHDFESEDWLEDGEGVFVHSPALVTPMGYGTAVFQDHGAAQEFLEKEKGAFISFEEISGMIHKNSVSIIGGENETNR